MHELHVSLVRLFFQMQLQTRRRNGFSRENWKLQLFVFCSTETGEGAERFCVKSHVHRSETSISEQSCNLVLLVGDVHLHASTVFCAKCIGSTLHFSFLLAPLSGTQIEQGVLTQLSELGNSCIAFWCIDYVWKIECCEENVILESLVSNAATFPILALLYLVLNWKIREKASWNLLKLHSAPDGTKNPLAARCNASCKLSRLEMYFPKQQNSQCHCNTQFSHCGN